MGVESIIDKIVDESDSGRSVLEVPLALIFEDGFLKDELFQEAKRVGVINQLGILVDLTLIYIINEAHPKYKRLKELSEFLYDSRVKGDGPFYRGEDPLVTSIKKRRLEKMVGSDELKLLKKWEIVAVLTPEKFKQVYEQEYEDRQAKSTGYSS